MLCLQEDGNLVVYTRDGKVAWASNTDNKSTDAYTLEVSRITSMKQNSSSLAYSSSLASPGNYQH